MKVSTRVDGVELVALRRVERKNYRGAGMHVAKGGDLRMATQEAVASLEKLHGRQIGFVYGQVPPGGQS
jgi:hypothetical protein